MLPAWLTLVWMQLNRNITTNVSVSRVAPRHGSGSSFALSTFLIHIHASCVTEMSVSSVAQAKLPWLTSDLSQRGRKHVGYYYSTTIMTTRALSQNSISRRDHVRKRGSITETFCLGMLRRQLEIWILMSVQHDPSQVLLSL